MSEQEKSVLTIKFTNGTEQMFEYSKQAEEYAIGGRIKEAVSNNMLILELANKTLFIPYNNVLSIEVSPSPPKLPETAIRGVRQLN